MSDARRRLPAVTRLLALVGGQGSRLATTAAREVLAEARRSGEVPDLVTLQGRLAERLASLGPGLAPVLNATGVVIHTNLGRAPLSEAAVQATKRAAAGYSDLELDLESGRRDSRLRHSRLFLSLLTGAEDHLVVNNNAAAVFLALAALARDREVIISRGELVEIGGSFRVPDIMAASGARLIEVGTTNRTHLKDFAQAITPHTAAIMRVHPSNFRQTGFVTSPELTELAALAREKQIALLDDLGSGSLLPLPGGEPTVAERIGGGSDLVFFSGDKLLGGPQAGIVAGKKTLVERLYTHPLYRAVRADKMTLAALRATLYDTLEGPLRVPVYRMLTEPDEKLRQRAEELAARLAERGVKGVPVAHAGRAGGGSLPEVALPGWAVRLEVPVSAQDAQAALRRARPAVLGVVSADALLLDVRTLTAGDLDAVAWAVAARFGKADQVSE